MARSKARPGRPTEGELAILNVVWERGEATVREVHAALAEETGQRYTTVLKLMQIMTDKGLLERDTSERSHRYRPKRSREHTQGRLVRDLIEHAFSGSSSQLVVRALAARPASANERAEIRRLLDALDEEGS